MTLFPIIYSGDAIYYYEDTEGHRDVLVKRECTFCKEIKTRKELLQDKNIIHFIDIKGFDRCKKRNIDNFEK